MPEESNPQKDQNNQQEQNQSQQNNQQSQQGNDNSHLFGFFERVLDTVLSRKPVESTQSSHPSETIDSTGNAEQTQDDSKQQEVINQLQSQIEELKKQISESTDSSGGTDASTNSQESTDSNGDDGTDNDNSNQTAQFPDSKPDNGRRKSKRDRYLEIAQKSPRKAAKYFQEYGSEILSGVRFFE